MSWSSACRRPRSRRRPGSAETSGLDNSRPTSSYCSSISSSRSRMTKPLWTAGAPQIGRSVGRGGRELALAAENFFERRDGDLDLAQIWWLGGDLLEPQSGSHERPHRSGPRELGTEAKQLVGDTGDRRYGDDAEQHPGQD